ncbi:MAG: protease HtpX [Arenicellaceae bacterium]|nr:protease HtpX [Arenicellaceae bacterium]
MGRIFYFLLTNLAVIFVLNIVMQIFGIGSYLEGSGINYQGLLVFSFIVGMAGSIISLFLSKWMAKRSTRAKVIEQPSNETEQWLLETVKCQAEGAGIGVPEVAIYDSPDVNAFATGASRNNALVAVSSGLLRSMSRDEAEAVLGHEVSHVANGDMITLTLVQGIVNTFVVFFSRVVGYFIDRVIFKNANGHGIGFWVGMIVSQMVFGALASMVVAYFSRIREFRADSGGAHLAGKQKMIDALERLKSGHAAQLPDQLAAFGISGAKQAGWKRLLMSHPPLDERIAVLKSSTQM